MRVDSVRLQRCLCPEVCMSMSISPRSPPKPQVMARVESLSEAHFSAANAIFNDFIGGSGKRACCGLCSCKNCPESEESYRARYKKHPELLPFSAVAVRESDGRVIGVMKLTANGIHQDTCDECLHKPKVGELYIDYLAVMASARGQGAGTRLLEWAEAVAKDHGSTHITLGVVNGNPARRLYERHGFVITRQEICEKACSDGCSSCCLYGCPHGQYGGVMMEKRLGA